MNTEKEASEGLNICGYYWKWERAKQYVKLYPKPAFGYWDHVRLHFLETGGGYIHECPLPPVVQKRPMPWIPPVTYDFEYRKIRRA